MRNGILKLFFISLLITNLSLAAVGNSAMLTQIENNLFGIDYPKENDIKRLQRIEKVLYGSDQKGTLESRIKKITQDTGTVIEEHKKPVMTKNDINIPIKPQEQTQTNQPNKEEYVAEDSTVDYPIVDKMEQKVFNKTYKSENIYSRLDRLEKTVFNSTSKEVLNSRVEKLSDTLLYNEKTAQNNDYLPYPEQIKQNTENYGRYGNNASGTYSDDNLTVMLAAIERNNLNSIYINDSIGQRLNRLEKNMLGKTFPQDTPQNRIERLMAVNMAQNNSSMYDNNKMMRNVATFSQIGGIILMILAMIL